MNREAWLTKATTILTKQIFNQAGYTVPEVKVSVGWPSRGATSEPRTIGQCWYGSTTGDGVAQIFISPVLEKPAKVLATLTHEILHAVLPEKTGHGPGFRKAMSKVGLTGKPTNTEAGKGLKDRLKVVADTLSDYPHSKVSPKMKLKKQSTRMIKAECLECGYTVRLTRKWIAFGLPICPTDEISMTDMTDPLQALLI